MAAGINNSISNIPSYPMLTKLQGGHFVTTENKVIYFIGLNTKNRYYENVTMLQMKIYTFFFQQVSLFSYFDNDLLKNHALKNAHFSGLLEIPSNIILNTVQLSHK